MARCEWIVDCPQRHVVQLEHDYWSGRVVIWIDGEEVYRRRFMLVDWGFHYRHHMDGIDLALKAACPSGIYYDYELHVNGERIVPSRVAWTWRFSLRALLAVMTLSALILGTVATFN